MTANNANSKIRIENCQRFMETQLVLSQELLFPAPAVNRAPPPGGGVRADRAVGGWSRPSGLHTSAVSHWALAAEVPQGLKAHRNAAFDAALKRYSTQLKNSPKNQNLPAIPRGSILLCPVWAGRPRGKLPAAPSPYLRQSPVLPVGPATRDDPWWAAAYAR